MAQVWSSRSWTRQPLTKEVWLDRNNQLCSLIVGGVFPAVRTDYRNRGLTGLFANSTQQALLGSLGGANYYVRGSGQVGLVGSSTAGGSAATHHHTILILANGVGGSSYIYDSSSDGLTNHHIRLSSGNLQWLVQGQNLFSNTTVPIPSTGLVTMVLYSGQYLGANPFAVINGTTYTGTAANQDSFYAPGYSTWFGSSAFPAANTFSGTGIMVVIFKGRLSDDAIVSLRANPWQLFAPQRQVSYFLPPPPSALEITPVMQRMPRVWTRQPPAGVEINWSNPLSRGLALAALGGPTFFRDVAQNSTFTRGAQTIVTGGGVGGTYVARTGSSSSSSLYFSAKQASSGGYTVGSVVVDNSGRGVTRSPIDSDNFPSPRNFQLRLLSSNVPEFIPFDNFANPYFATGTAAVNDRAPVVLLGRVSGNVGSLWVNGLNVASTGTISNQVKNIAVGDSLMIGERIGGGNFFTGQIYLSVYWARPLSDAEIASFSANPWQLFAPQRTVTYSLPTAPSAVQTKTAFRSSRPVRTTQPNGPVSVDWNNSITNGLAAITHAPMRYEAVSKRIASTSGPYRTAGYRSRNVPGIARQFLRSSNQSQDLWPATGTTGDVTLLVFGTLYLSSSSNQKLCRLTNSSDADIIYFGEQSNNAMTFIVNPVGGGGTSISFGSPSIGSTTLARMFVGRISGTAVTAWLDGRQSGSSTIASNNFSTIARLYNGSTAFLEQPEGVLVLAAYWKRALTDAEIQGISINPWQLFAPQSQIIYSLASVKPSLSAPAATSITNTTATPQVTLNL